jgi:hypothetical protein
VLLPLPGRPRIMVRVRLLSMVTPDLFYGKDLYIFAYRNA